MSRKEIVDHYTIYSDQILGKGNFATVYLAMDNITSELCAAKVQKEELADAIKEAEILERIRNLKSNHLMKLLHFKIAPKCVYLFIERMSGTLRDFLDERRRLAESEALFYFHQIMLGLNDIHSANMIHRDIKPDNIFLNGDKVKIGDFNISSEHAISKSALGTFGYMSPHMLRLNQNTASIISTGQKNYDCSVDIWSAGVLLYELLYGKAPFPRISVNPKRIAEDQLELYKKYTGKNLHFPENQTVSKPTMDLLSKMLDMEHYQRLTAGLILNTECFRRFIARVTPRMSVQQSWIQPFEMSSDIRKSSILSASVLINQNQASYTSSLEIIQLLGNIDRVFQNEKSKLHYFMETSNQISSFLIELRSEYQTEIQNEGVSQIRWFFNKTFLFNVILRLKLYFMLRELEYNITELEGVNILIKRNSHILQGEISAKQWSDLKKGGSQVFSEITFEVIEKKRLVQKDIESQDKDYRVQFGKWNLDEMTHIQDLLKHKNEKSFSRFFIKSLKVFWISTLDLMDLMEKKSLQETSQSLIVHLYFQIQNEKTPRIDWQRYKTKITYLPKEEVIKLNEDLRKHRLKSLMSSLQYVALLLLIPILAYYLLK